MTGPNSHLVDSTPVVDDAAMELEPEFGDATLIMSVLLEIRADVRTIKRLLTENDGEEEEEDG